MKEFILPTRLSVTVLVGFLNVFELTKLVSRSTLFIFLIPEKGLVWPAVGAFR